MSGSQHLVIVTHVAHYLHDGRLHAYGPYVREIDVWCDLFERVTIAGPCLHQRPPGDCLPLDRSNVGIRPVKQSGGRTIFAKGAQLLLMPQILFALCRAMAAADAIHIRCPGNLGLLGVLLGPLFSRRLIAKYAGQWTGYPGEPLSVRLQRRLLASSWWRGPVTVYGQWPDQPDHVVPFFTSVISSEQLKRLGRPTRARAAGQPLSILYVGRLTKSKNVATLIDAVGQLAAEGADIRCEIIGEGPEEAVLREQTQQLALGGRVVFAGGLPFEQVLEHYQRADVLVLVSETEGWPKAIAEAMACGLVCVGSDRGLVPWLLDEGRGFAIPPGDATALAETLRTIARSPELQSEMSQRASAFGQRYSLENLREALRELLVRHWQGKPEACLSQRG